MSKKIFKDEKARIQFEGVPEGKPFHTILALLVGWACIHFFWPAIVWVGAVIGILSFAAVIGLTATGFIGQFVEFWRKR